MHRAITDSLTEFRHAFAAAVATYIPQARTIEIPLPGPDYEPFILSQGCPVYWRSEPISQGRLVRFKATGPASIGLHYHEVPEVITAAAGILHYSVGGASRALIPGETFTAQPHELHSAEFRAPGEALAHWPALDSDLLDIAFFQ